MSTLTDPAAGTPDGETFRAERTNDEVLIRVPTFARLMRAVMPEEAVKHMLAAQREQLLALRVVIDRAIERLEKAEDEGGFGGPRRTEIRIE